MSGTLISVHGATAAAADEFYTSENWSIEYFVLSVSFQALCQNLNAAV